MPGLGNFTYDLEVKDGNANFTSSIQRIQTTPLMFLYQPKTSQKALQPTAVRLPTSPSPRRLRYSTTSVTCASEKKLILHRQIGSKKMAASVKPLTTS